MAIVKNQFRVSTKLKGGGGGGEFSPMSKENNNSMSTDDEDELQKQQISMSDYDEDDLDERDNGDEDEDEEDIDSGMDSDDDVDVSELGAVGEELCQIGNQISSVPFELYDLSGLGDIFSVDVWNDCLTEEERFGLSKYLPDMDQETFLRTMMELFSGTNFHFGSPIIKLFDMLKGGLCEPRVMLYQQGWNFFQKFRHYHLVRNYQNSMVSKFALINNAWLNCKGYSIQERLRVLNLMRSQKSLMYEKREDIMLESDSSGREDVGDGFWTKKLNEFTRGSKMGPQAIYTGIPIGDASIRGRVMPNELENYENQNAKGILKLGGAKVSAAESLQGFSPSNHRGMETKSRPYDSLPVLPRKQPVVGYDVGTARHGTLPRGVLPKVGKGNEFLKSTDAFSADSLIGFPLPLRNDASHSQRKNWNLNQLAQAEDYMYTPKRGTQLPSAKVDGSSGKQNFLRNKIKDEAFSMDYPVNSEDWDIKGNKYKIRPEFRPKKNNVGFYPKAKGYEPSLSQANDMLAPSSQRSMKSEKKFKRESVRNGLGLQFRQSDETESDSSEQVDEEGTNLFRRKSAYPTGMLQARSRTLNDDLDERLHLRDVEVYTLKGKQKGKVHDPRYSHNYSTGILEDSGLSGFAKNASDNGKKAYKSVKIEHMSEPVDRMHRPLLRAHPHPSVKKKKGNVDYEYRVSNYSHDYMEEDGDLRVTHSPIYLDDRMKTDRMGKKGPLLGAHANDRHERLNMPLLECSSAAKKRKGKGDVIYVSVLDESNKGISQQQVDDPSLSKKKGKREPEVESDSPSVFSSEKGLIDADPDTKSVKKPFPLITPSIHTGFSFSVVHLLSAVRVAMVTPLADDVSDIGKHIENSDGRHCYEKEEQNGKHETVTAKPLGQPDNVMDASTSEQTSRNNLPSLTVQEIVNRVRSSPGDPCILETQEPLQDLVRGVLKIFISKTAPLGAKGWKALVSYEKSSKSWSWIGPVSSSTSDPDKVEEVTSFEAWGIPYKMLVKLVDSFANWLKNGQETLQQIGSLPPPPLELMQPNLDEKERFRDLRAQKSLTTISPSSEEVRAYFRREEVLRYLVPDRAFSYTAADGRKSIVAPLRRGGGKPTSKARDHPILKPDRPPHVTILCLVRDAAARLPGNIGTRADVCTLIKDSQYIVEDVNDLQVNQVVSGALDRLHYERDPCVQFDGERKLWVYLHRDREEEDFEDDGTSSTKKWKRPRKDATEQSDSATVNVAYPGTGEQGTVGSEAASVQSADHKSEPSSTHIGERVDILHHGLGSKEVENTGPFVGSEQGRLHQGRLMDWEGLGLNTLQENKMLCQENSTNEDYDDETFTRDRSVGLLSASIKNGVT
ncbi:hypothetical protein IFM89_027879 [Coptis chinensis]|uniref:DEUBAD domain-containing protein n=1 Tax=Coptis chinensis TaxID=261450 RepID=A0A835HG26_9MAGN|nr:hypothetical protein IFM89_027879 [Coptis chinensis]